MPPVSHPFKKGALVILMNYNDHDPPHVHVKYQRDVRSYRIEIGTRKWMKPGKELSPNLKKMVRHGLKLTNKNCSNNGREQKIINQF